MKKVSVAGGTILFCLIAALALEVLLTGALSSTAQAQGSWNISVAGLQRDTFNPSDAIGTDRKLKAMPGVNALITAPAGDAGTEVRLTAVVRGEGIQGLSRCNAVIATATTRPFLVRGSRTLTANDFTARGGIGIQSSTENQGCIDDIVDKVIKGLGTAPIGRYVLQLTLNDARTGAFLTGATEIVEIVAAAASEIVLNLISPENGEQIPQASNIVFTFDALKEGRLLVFEHNLPGQSSQDATSNLNSPLKVMDVAFYSRGVNQVTATYPGNALRPFQAGKRYSWLVLASVDLGGGRTEERRSPIYSFSVIPSDPSFTNLVNALSGAPDPVGSTFSNLLAAGYSLNFSSTNPVRISEGDNPARPIDISQVLSLLADLSRRGSRLNVSITTE